MKLIIVIATEIGMYIHSMKGNAGISRQDGKDILVYMENYSTRIL